MRQLGDIKGIHGGEIESVDCIIGGSPCFPAGTLVLTNKGYAPIEEFPIAVTKFHFGDK